MSKGREFIPYGEKKFDRIIDSALGSSDRISRITPIHKENICDLLPIDYTAKCWFHGCNILGCEVYSQHGVYLIDLSILTSSGVPHYPHLTHSVLWIPTCSNCRLLFLHLVFGMRCKSGWERGVSMKEHVSVGKTKVWIDDNEEKFLAMIYPDIDRAQKYLDRLIMRQVKVVVLEKFQGIGTALQHLSPSDQLSYIDIREMKTCNRITLKFWDYMGVVGG